MEQSLFSRERGFDQSSCSSNTHIFHGMLSFAKRLVPWTCWVAWDEMTKPKYLGGLGFRDIEIFNMALLARQTWRLLQDLTSLSARVLKAAYYPDGEFPNADLGMSLSRIW
jgi:hypothetical protein